MVLGGEDSPQARAALAESGGTGYFQGCSNAIVHGTPVANVLAMLEELASQAFWIGLAKIIGVNIILSGDNAVVIALAARSLPPKQQKAAIFWGSGAAIVMRIVLTVVAVELLKLSYLKLVGSVLLLWIAVQLLLPEDEGHGGAESSSNLASAIKTILLADLVMSLDNVIAVAAAAKGNTVLKVIANLQTRMSELETRLNWRFLDFRAPQTRAIFTIQNRLLATFRGWLTEDGMHSCVLRTGELSEEELARFAVNRPDFPGVERDVAAVLHDPPRRETRLHHLARPAKRSRLLAAHENPFPASLRTTASSRNRQRRADSRQMGSATTPPPAPWPRARSCRA